MLYIGVALFGSSAAYARGSPVVFHMEADHPKFVSIAPPRRAVVVQHPRKHHRYRRMHTR
jgi:hypothetical protein